MRKHNITLIVSYATDRETRIVELWIIKLMCAIVQFCGRVHAVQAETNVRRLFRSYRVDTKHYVPGSS